MIEIIYFCICTMHCYFWVRVIQTKTIILHSIKIISLAKIIQNEITLKSTLHFITFYFAHVLFTNRKSDFLQCYYSTFAVSNSAQHSSKLAIVNVVVHLHGNLTNNQCWNSESGNHCGIREAKRPTSILKCQEQI